MEAAARLLLVEDSDDDARLIERVLHRSNPALTVSRIATLEDLDRLLEEDGWDLILSDHNLQGFTGVEVLARVLRTGRDLPYILVSGALGEDLAAELMRGGAKDFIRKTHLERLGPTVARELADREIRRQHQASLEALQENERRLRIVADFTYDWEYWIDQEGRIAWMSPSCERITGYPAEAFKADPGLIEQICHPEDRTLLQQHNGEVGEAAAKAPLQLRILHRDGRQVWINHICTPVVNQGRPAGRRVANRDVTEQKRAENTLEQAYRFNAQIIDSVQEGVIVYGTDLRYRAWNRFMEQISGLAASQVLGRRPEEVFPFVRGTGVLAALERALAGESQSGIDVPFHVAQTGRRGWTIHANAPFRGVNGEILGVIATVYDITERKRQEMELRRLNRLYELLSQLGQNLVRVRTEDEMLQAFCDTAARTGEFPLVWVGWLDPATKLVKPIAKAGEAVGYLDGVVFSAAAQPEGLGPTGRCIRENRHIVVQDFAADPSMQHWIERLTPFSLRSGVAVPLTSRGSVIGAFVAYSRETGFFLDREVELLREAADTLSFGLDRFATERQKEELQAHLVQSQKMESLGVLAGGVAHDMNNVLGAILGLASANIETQPEGSPAYRAFEIIQKSAERGGEMVKRLLTFARQKPSDQREVDVNEILLDVVQLLERTTLSRIQLETHLAPDRMAVLGDASALNNAFMNLCVNSVDAMPPNGRLTLGTRRGPDGRIEVSFWDTGCGMTEEVLKRALDPFFTTKEVGKGTGLGLSMVYSIVKSHQGDMEIQSQPGVGTVVTLRFPACNNREHPPQTSSPAQASLPDLPLEVMLVDDDALINSSMVAILEALGHRVTATFSGESALLRLESGVRPDVVLLDMNMPGLGGSGTLPRLRELDSEMPILVTTGRVDQEALDLASSYSGVTLLSKPFGMKELREQLRAVADRKIRPAAR